MVDTVREGSVDGQLLLDQNHCHVYAVYYTHSLPLPHDWCVAFAFFFALVIVFCFRGGFLIPPTGKRPLGGRWFDGAFLETFSSIGWEIWPPYPALTWAGDSSVSIKILSVLFFCLFCGCGGSRITTLPVGDWMPALYGFPWLICWDAGNWVFGSESFYWVDIFGNYYEWYDERTMNRKEGDVELASFICFCFMYARVRKLDLWCSSYVSKSVTAQ